MRRGKIDTNEQLPLMHSHSVFMLVAGSVLWQRNDLYSRWASLQFNVQCTCKSVQQFQRRRIFRNNWIAYSRRFGIFLSKFHLETNEYQLKFKQCDFLVLSVAWFTFDPVLSHIPNSGLVFSKNNSTVSVDGWEHQVALGSVGFSRGIHYWEFTIDAYTADTDPAFGIARLDVARDQMLGKNF